VNVRVAKTICPRCAAPLRRADGCDRCGPIVAHVLDPGPVATTWPEARRWLDDIRPRADHRRHLVAAVCLAGAVLLVLLALL
jgi:predicted amidophosphoribosyltransferase